MTEMKERALVQEFTQRTFLMGDGQEFRWDKALAVADEVEDEELIRKLPLRWRNPLS